MKIPQILTLIHSYSLARFSLSKITSTILCYAIIYPELTFL